MIMYKKTFMVSCIMLLVTNAAHAGIFKDIRRVSIGVGAGAALGYGLTVLNEPHMVEAGLITDKTMPVCALIGAAVGSWFTSYGKAFRAQIALLNLDDKLIALVMNAMYGKTTVEIVDEIQDYYHDTALPLIEGVKGLIKQDDYLGAAIGLLDFVVDTMDDDPVQQKKYIDWVNELRTMRTCIRYAITVINQDPRFTELLKRKALQDLNLEA